MKDEQVDVYGDQTASRKCYHIAIWDLGKQEDTSEEPKTP